MTTTIYSFGNASRQKLHTCCPELVQVAERVMSYQIMDFTIVWGHRGKAAQDKAFAEGASKKQWPDSLHNVYPSDALDFAPWITLPNGRGGIDWSDNYSFVMLAGLFLAAGAELEIELRYGGDWDRDGSTKDQTFMDLGHIEVVRP